MAREEEIVEILVLGDTHVGRKTDTFNLAVFKDKVDKYIGCMALARRFYMSSGKEPDKTVLFLVGDIVDGEEIYRGQGYEQDLTVHEQIEEAAVGIEKIIDKLGVDEVVAVSGNHGRSNWRGTGNWDYMLYEVLRGRLFSRRVGVEMSKEGKTKAEYGGVSWLLWHPYEVRMYMSLPYYGLSRQGVVEALVRGVNAAVLGHFHTAFYINVHGVHLFGNGSFLEGDEFSRRRGWLCDSRYWYLVAGNSKILYQTLVDVGCRDAYD